MLILGIDPGTATTGYGYIKVENNKCIHQDFGLIETKNNGDVGKRLIEIQKLLNSLLKNNRPNVVIIERLFFANNAKTAMSVGQAIGVILYTIARNNIKTFEYAPGTVKKTITGDGRADKKMIQQSLRKILGASVRSRVKGKTHFDNAADALAVAVCHALITCKIKL